jgi:hypothetical protein
MYDVRCVREEGRMMEEGRGKREEERGKKDYLTKR